MDDKKQEEKEEVNQDERDRLLYELVVRQSALEKALIKAEVITDKILAESQVECMEKLKEVIDKKTEAAAHPGFVKYGENHVNHESQEKE